MTNDVVSRLAARCLKGYDDLIDAWLPEVMAIEPYARGLVPPEEVRAGARVGFALILRVLADGRTPEELAPHSEGMGERRAGQGVPLESLLAAARLDAKVLWHGLIAQAEPDDLPGLLRSANLVWEAVEQHNTGLMTGYQRAVLEMGRQREDQRRTWFARLLDNDGRNPDVVRDAGRVLGFDTSAAFVAVVTDGSTGPLRSGTPPDSSLADPAAGASLRAAVSTLALLGLRLHRHDAPTGDILVVQLPARAGGAERVVLDALAGVPCGVSPEVAGLARIPHAVRLAAATARAAAPEGGPVRLEDSWLEVFTAHSPELSAELAARVLGPLYTVGAAERERLLETVRVHLAGDGAIAATAAALYCHRNTIQHRFARFKELTGRDVRAPEDAAVIALALRAATF
ncbi:PucR family transcriptional regulator [Nonomuraea endophytica]|uniref:Sugar diacid utilization regulator n=1 Tax=Nonomuraea endophytica TaxID=714136 RepID=A0A7W8AGY9_9ACTN|nr:helix-turn-helix domain-containing protein [Nonomuraea endophytica]MBB5084936.1 sugar diacid utilization regulator [Nonomuraea endophytica]